MRALKIIAPVLGVVFAILFLQNCQSPDEDLSTRLFEVLEDTPAPSPNKGEAFYVLLTSDTDCKTCYESFKHLENGTLSIGLFYSKTPALFKEFLENNTSGISWHTINQRDVITLAEQALGNHAPFVLRFNPATEKFETVY